MKIFKCILCGEEFKKPADKVEHVIFKALGGKSGSHELVCGWKNSTRRECNNTLGTVEEALTLLPPILYARAVLGLGRSSDLKARFITKDGHEVEIGRGGTLSHAKPVLRKEIEDLPDNLKRFSFTFKDEVSKDKVLRKLKKKRNVTNVQTEIDVRWWETELSSGEYYFGTEEQYRAISKLAFVALGYMCDWVDIHSKAFNEIRQFVHSGSIEKHKALAWFQHEAIFTVLPLQEAIYNRVTIYCDPNTGLITSFIEILGHYPFSVLLAEGYKGSKKAAQLVNYPVNKTRKSDEVTVFEDFNSISLEQLYHNDRVDPRLGHKRAWQGLGKAVFDHNHDNEIYKFEDFTKRLIRAACLNVGFEGKQFFDHEDFAYMARYVSERAYFFTDLSVEELEQELLDAFINLEREFLS